LAIYTPLYKTLNAVKQYKPSYQLGTSRRSTGSGMTPYEQELLPYVQQAQTGQQRKRNWLQPIEFAFDLLSRGQYMTANTAKQITRNIREGRPVLEGVPREAWEGITGKEKGDWSTVLWGGADKGGEQFEGWGQKAGEKLEKSWWGRRAKGGAALAANILLDPTTYLPGFKPAAKAITAGRELSEDAMQIAIKKALQETGERLSAQGVDELTQKATKEALEAALSRGKEVPETVSKLIGKDLNKEYSQLIRASQRRALRQPAAVLRKEVAGEAQETARALKTGIYKNLPKAERVEKLKGLSDLIQKVKTTEAYSGAGTRAGHFFRKEFAVGERYPTIIKAWDKAADWVRNTKIGNLFNDAWWSRITNPNSVVGHLRKMFNIRTPYQQYLHNIQSKFSGVSQVLRDEFAKTYFGATKDLADDEKDLLKKAWMQLQGAQPTPGAGTDILDVLKVYNVPTEKAVKIKAAKDKIQSMFESAREYYLKKFQEDPTLFGKPPGSVPDPDWGIAQYLPMVTKRTDTGLYPRARTIVSPSKEGYLTQRTTTFLGERKLEKDTWRFLLPGASDEQIMKLMDDYNLTNYINMNLDEMVLGRMFAEARMRQNIELVEAFREFGLPLDDLKLNAIPEAKYALQNNFNYWGLQKIDDSRLGNYLFDDDVVDIIKRTVQVTQSDETLRAWEKIFHNSTSWWKGWATLSPGFHLRNFYSNNVTGFLKHGMEWMNPDTQMRSAIATMYGLYGEDAIGMFGKIGIPEQYARDILNTKWGEYTLGELADKAARRGVISKATMGFDIPTTIEGMLGKTNWNPLSTKFAPMKASRNIGNVIESQPRFMSFLLDYKRGGLNDAAFDWAVTEAKKWFIDYMDLSPFEQKVMKNAIPFYTWIRKNLANQIAGMMEFTEMYSMLPKISSGGPEGEGIPDYMRNVGYFPIQQILGGKGDVLRMMWPNLPYMDVNKIPLKFEISDAGIPIPKVEMQEFLNDILSNAHPVLKTIGELIPEEGWDVYYRRPLQEGVTTPEVMNKLTRVVAANPQLLQFIDGFLVKIGVEGGLSAKIDDKGRLMMDPKLARILSNNIPLLQKINQYGELPEFLVESVKATRKKVQDEKDQSNRAALGLRVLSFYLGVKFKDVDMEKELAKEGDAILREAEEALRKERKKSPQYKQAQLRTIRSRLLRKQRLGING
jgi:hypothetical protein